MRRQDAVFSAILALTVLPFALSAAVREGYGQLNAGHPLLLSFVKFGVLATLGEVIALRIRAGVYHRPGFGIVPRALVWGVLGIGIYAAFAIFSSGTPVFLRAAGVPVTAEVMGGSFGALKLAGAFAISAAMNLVFAPVMMTTHRVTDEHIARTGGTVRGLLRPIAVGEILGAIDWRTMWGFVFKKTIPLFWIPAHTVTFLLPGQHRVLFAALLSVALGVLLAVASLRPSPGPTLDPAVPKGGQ